MSNEITYLDKSKEDKAHDELIDSFVNRMRGKNTREALLLMKELENALLNESVVKENKENGEHNL